MKLNEYQEAARRTAVYNTPLMYPSLGLAGEAGELIEKIFEGAKRDVMLKESGDVLWYCASVAEDTGLTLEACAGVYATFKGMKVPVDFDDLGDYMAQKLETELAIAVGKVCEAAKKIDRDGGGQIRPDKRDDICINIGRVLYLLQDLALEHESNLGEVAQDNLDKLASRAERGVLKGDGDER